MNVIAESILGDFGLKHCFPFLKHKSSRDRPVIHHMPGMRPLGPMGRMGPMDYTGPMGFTE